MTASIIAFPADRCRLPTSAIRAAEQLAFRGAKCEFASTSTEAKQGSIKTMMTLACVGMDELTREAAAAWLMETCNVSVSGAPGTN